jgi:ATP-dependent Clp protease ATP-binding subunit ClpC
MLQEVAARVSNLGISLTAEEEALDLLAASGFDPVYGARPLRRSIQNAVEDSIAEKLLDGKLKAGDSVTLKSVGGKTELIKDSAQ